MAKLALSDLFDSETQSSVLSTLLAVATSVGSKVTSWASGGVYREMYYVNAQKVSDLTAQMAEAAKGGLLDYATEGWLTLLAASLYRLTRIPAAAATGPYGTFTNGSTTAKTFAAGALVLAHSVSGKTYRNLADVTVAPGATVSGIALLADEAGTASNAATGALSLLKSITNCTATNTASLLGVDEETDDQLRARCRSKLGALSPNGPKEAYAFVATTQALDDGTIISQTTERITRTQPWLDTSTGVLHVYLATATGAPLSSNVGIIDDAFGVWAEPWGVQSEADAAIESVTDVTYQIWVRGNNATIASIQATVATALAGYFSTMPIGGDVIPPATGSLYVDTIRAVITQSVAGCVKCVVVLPSADVVLGVGKVAKLGNVAGTVTVLS